MSEEALMIMRMVQEGKITPEQGVSLLNALKSERAAAAQADAARPEPSANGTGDRGSDNAGGSFGSWGSVAQTQRLLAETQQRFAEMQAKLGAAASGNGASASSASIKLPFGMGEFNVSQILDETLRGVTALKSEAVISAKKAARQAQKEARRFRHEAERMGKNIHVEVHFRTDGERPRNANGYPERSESSVAEFDLPLSGAVAITNLYGDVKVTGTSDDGRVHITAEKSVWADTAAGDDALRAIDVASAVEPNGDLALSVAVDAELFPRMALGADAQVAVQLTVHLPAKATVHVKTTSGQVQCESFDGGLGVRTVETTSGDVRLLHIHSVPGQSAVPNQVTTRSGSVSISQWRGGSLVVETVSGEAQMDKLEASRLRVTTHSGDMHLQSLRVSGDVFAETISGDITLENLTAGAACAVKSQSGDVELNLLEAATLSLETVSGDLNSRGCACASGRVAMKSISGDIEAEEIAASDLTLNSTSGKAEVALAEGFTGSVVGASVSGDVEVTLPAAYTGRLTLTTHSGEIKCKAPLAGREGDGKQYLSGTLSGKAAAESAPAAPGLASVMLQSVSGDLTVAVAA